MPYLVKGKCVHKKNPDGSAGKVVKCHPTTDAAKAHVKALYKSVPDAKGKKMKKEKYELTEDQMVLQLAGLRKALKLEEKPVQENEQVPVVVGEHGPEVFIPLTYAGGLSTTTNLPYNINIYTGPVTPQQTAERIIEKLDLADTPPASHFSPIRLYFREGEQTPDGRCIDPNAVNFNRPPPYSIRLQTVQPEHGGHAGAVVCGVITKIARDGLTIISDGFLDLSLESGQLAHQLITNKTMQTWSPDLGDAVIDTERNATDEDANEASGLEQVDHFIKATFLGATLVAMPALASAVVELYDESGNITVAAPSRGDPRVEPAGKLDDGTGLLKYIVDRADNTPAEIAACAGPVSPPRAFFTDPELPELQRYVTITPEGRFFTHTAGFGECHIGYRRQCVTIDQIADCGDFLTVDDPFAYATTGRVLCDDGSYVSTGPITIKGGHAARGLPWQETLSHYDDPAMAVADVVYGVDQFGIWASGAIRPTATVDQIRTLLASGVSLDAREIDGKLRYLATCAVNTPGYPKVSARLVASSEESDDVRVVALIAPGGPPESVLTDDCACTDCE